MHRKRIVVLDKFDFILDDGETITIYKTKTGTDFFLVIVFADGAIQFDKFPYKKLLTCEGNMPFRWLSKNGELKNTLEKTAFSAFLSDFQRKFGYNKIM